MQKWLRQDDSKVQDFHVFRLREHTATSPRTGVASRYVGIEAPDWVNVLAITRDGQAILVRQYRHGIDEIALEIPGGIVDPGELPATAAARELLEETGFQAGTWQVLGVCQPNPALFNNRCHSFLAFDCQRVSDQQLDGGEDIQIELVPLGELGELLSKGAIQHALVIAACFWYLAAGQPCGPLLTAQPRGTT